MTKIERREGRREGEKRRRGRRKRDKGRRAQRETTQIYTKSKGCCKYTMKCYTVIRTHAIGTNYLITWNAGFNLALSNKVSYQRMCGQCKYILRKSKY